MPTAKSRQLVFAAFAGKTGEDKTGLVCLGALATWCLGYHGRQARIANSRNLFWDRILGINKRNSMLTYPVC